ncbi:MAG: glycoside hydrolase family 13 protein [Oscillibacter sp.]|nr:glycoside hydrolase family 13 protein [Oscillibacter sp.]
MKIVLLLFLSLFLCGAETNAGQVKKGAKSPVQRVEPMNWWVGMRNPELQILVYGKNVAAYRPEVAYPGVKIDRVVTTENPNYQFIYLTIGADTPAGDMEIVFKKDGKTAFTYPYPLWKREENSAMRKGFDNSDAIYLLMPDRFANGNPANDSHPEVTEKADRSSLNGRHGGDIQGIIDHLDYLQELGMTALWSTPLMEDNMAVTSYHTYAISDYYKIDPRYGTNADYKRLSAEAKKRGIKLIMDVVTNHCASAHWWMNDLPAADWLHQFDTFTRSNYRMGTIPDPYASEVDRELNSKGWFDTSMPDLNQRNPLLMDYLIQNAIWWIEFADLGGLRIDTYPYNHKEAMVDFNLRILKEYPDFNIVGETWVHAPSEVAYWQKDALNADGFNSELPTGMDFPLLDALAVFTKEKQGWDSGIMRPYSVFSQDYVYAYPYDLLIFADNHDTERIWEVLNGNVADFKLVFSILMTARGIPQMYYGTEIMMRGEKRKGDGDIRRDFPGGWQGDGMNAFTAAGRTKEQNEVFDFVKKLLNWRKVNPVIHTGAMKHFIPENEVYVYFRYNEDKKVMVVLNNSDGESKTLDMKRFAEVSGDCDAGVDVISGKRFTGLRKSLTVPAKSALILELE